jgi:hypothetical protein
MTKKKPKRKPPPPQPGGPLPHPVHRMVRLLEERAELTAEEASKYDQEFQLFHRVMRAAKAGGASEADLRALAERLDQSYFDSVYRRLRTENATRKSARERRGIQDADYDREEPRAKSDKALANRLNVHPTTLSRYKKKRFG